MEANAEKIKDNANKPIQEHHLDKTSAIVTAIVVFGLCCLALTGVGALVSAGYLGGLLAVGGGFITSSNLAIGVAAGALTGLSVGGACLAAHYNPELPGLEVITEVGPNSAKLMQSQNLLIFFNLQTQKLSSQLGSTEKLLVEDTSTRSTQLGQQAGQAIDTLGQMMKAS